MIGRPNAVLVQRVRNKRGFDVTETARYLGKHPNTIRKMVDRGILPAKTELDSAGRKRRLFLVEDLDAYLDSLPDWCDSGPGEEPGSSGKESGNGHL